MTSTTSDVNVLAGDEQVGRNTYRKGTTIPSRPGDGSLSRSSRDQRTIPPNSLLWKYWGDYRQSLVFLYVAAIENMWPQLGQGVSDHSQVFGDKANFLERGARTRVIITSTVYAAAAEASKTGLKIRNYHKSVKGSMPGGSDYHALNPETYYWAHATFLDGVYRYVDWFGRRPLTPAEKEQLFEESKEWFSLYGVDDVAQPESYTDFVSYFDDVVNNQLIDSSVAQYSLGFAHKPLPAPPGTPAMIAQLVWPRITALIRLTNIGVLHPVLRERLGLTWTDADQRNFERVSKLSRALAPVLERLPLKFRYERVAVEAFERVGIDPDRITLETARAALARARSAAADAVR